MCTHLPRLELRLGAGKGDRDWARVWHIADPQNLADMVKGVREDGSKGSDGRDPGGSVGEARKGQGHLEVGVG